MVECVCFLTGQRLSVTEQSLDSCDVTMQRISLSRAQAEWEGLVATAQLAELFFFLIKFLAKHLQQEDDIY